MEWYKSPNYSDVWEKDVDYVMFVDENNSVDAIDTVKKKLLKGEEISSHENIFTVTGCFFSRRNYADAKNNFENLRNKFWKDGLYSEKDKNTNNLIEKKVCFHSEDIRGKKKAFHNEQLKDELYKNFIIELDNTIKNTNYKIISININLKDYLLYSKYTEMNVYKIAFNFIIERFFYNIPYGKKANIVFEARGKKEDRILLEHIDKIINHTGTEYIRSYDLKKKITGVYFNKKKNHLGNPYVGLEIADLSSYPIYRFVKSSIIGKDFKTIREKIVCYPNCDGKGLKIYPKK